MSRFVQAQYALWRTNQGQQAWPSLKVVSLSVWVESQWQALQTLAAHSTAASTVLAPEQERLLWLQAISQSNHGYDLLADDSMADLAAEAWRTLRLWQKPLELLPVDTQEQKLLCSWVEHFTKLCTQKQVIDTTTRFEVVCECIEADSLRLPAQVVRLGFDEINPLQTRLFAALTGNGTKVTDDNVALESTCHRVHLADSETELSTMARWAAALFARDSTCSIGLVIPNLAHMRAQVNRVLTEVFEPQAVFADRPRHAPGFNMSAAQPLAQTPLIAAALAALQLNFSAVERELAQKLLNSPFLFDENELAPRARLFSQLSQRYINVPVMALRAASGETAAESEEPACPALHRRLLEFYLVSSGPSKRSYSAWAELFDRQLQVLGWPGTRTLDTLEFQQFEHWPQLLSQLASLDQVAVEVPLALALGQLGRLAYTPFHAQTADSPVQVLGLLEAAGMQFDYLWVMGLDNRVWPEPSKPNPLVPVELQRQWGMPRASAERELHIAQKLTERLSKSAHCVIISSPQVEGDQPLQPSPLISHLPELNSAELELSEGFDYTRFLMGQTLEQVNDEQAPSVEQPSNLRGGTQILKNQAACPFKAFAIHRLQAQAIEPLQLGITPIVRGNLLHRALETIWHQLQRQAALLALEEHELESCISSAVSDAWLSIRGQELLGSQLKRLEQQRAERLLKAWLELEKQRPPFKVIFNEKAVTYHLGDMPLVIRYDRIDELEDNSLLVLDYKTGRTDIGAWAGPRPDEPQVPLYTLAQGERVQAAAFVQINAQEVAAKGIAAYPDALVGLQAPEDLPRLDLPETWHGIVAHWRDALGALAADFLRGDARVDPKSRNLTCRYCDLHSLCRIRSQIDADEEPDHE